MVVMQSYELVDLPKIQKVGVYAIHNKRTDRYYIGSTKNIYHRFTLHMRALRNLYGINRKMDKDFQEPENFEDFEWIIIETFDDYTITNHELRWKERHYIIQFNAIENGYNTDYPNAGNIPEDELLAPHNYLTENDKQSITLYLPHYIKEFAKQNARKQHKNLRNYIKDLLDKECEANSV